MLLSQKNCITPFLFLRSYSTALPKETLAAVFHRNGSVDQVVKLEKMPLPTQLTGKQVLVKMLAAPINPADINIIEGNYGTTPSSFPAVAGNEGVGVVEAVGSSVSQFTPKQRVIPAKPGLGTWREYMICNEEDLQTVSNDIPVEYAASVAVNPCTAYRLLQDFAELKEGDVIVQNGANSAVGQCVIQMAKARGIKTINIIRDRLDKDEIINKLKRLGGDIVVTEDYANTSAMRNVVSDLPKAKLGLNCVGGMSVATLVRLMDKDSTVVTYGGMSRKPVTVPTGPFIFNNISLKGFWLTQWVNQHTKEERQKMIEEVSNMVKNKQLVMFMETHPFQKFQKALLTSLDTDAIRRRKVLLKFE